MEKISITSYNRPSLIENWIENMGNIQGNMLSWIVVKDLEKAIQFYTDVVGLTLFEKNLDYGWAELGGREGCRLGIAKECDMMDAKAGTNAVVTITVKNLEEACSLFKQKGASLIGEVLEVPGHVRMQTFVDSDGNTMQLVQKIA